MQCGADYTLLRDKLAAGEWELADNETRRLLCEVAGEDAAAREWVYFTEVKFIPKKDLQTMDKLWRAYSDSRYGFSVQRNLWIASKQQWGALFKRIAWVAGENNAYKKWPGEFTWAADAPKGHLPLTNCLRGTQLFQVRSPAPPRLRPSPARLTLLGAGDQPSAPAAAPEPPPCPAPAGNLGARGFRRALGARSRDRAPRPTAPASPTPILAEQPPGCAQTAPPRYPLTALLPDRLLSPFHPRCGRRRTTATTRGSGRMPGR